MILSLTFAPHIWTRGVTRTDHVWIGCSLWQTVFWFVRHSAERCTFESPKEIMGTRHYPVKNHQFAKSINR